MPIVLHFHVVKSVSAFVILSLLVETFQAIFHGMMYIECCHNYSLFHNFEEKNYLNYVSQLVPY